MSKFVYSHGLNPSQLHDVFPHHVVIGSDLRIKQVGQGLLSILYPQSPSTLENDNNSANSWIGANAEDFFSISMPTKCDWNWEHIKQYERTVFEVELINTNLLRRNGLRRLPLKGGIVVNSTPSDGSENSTATFLFSLSFTELNQLRDCGYSASDVSRFTFQRDVFLISKSHYIIAVITGLP